MNNDLEGENLPKIVKVGVAIIFDDVRKSILVGKRATSKQFEGKWEFIGGKVEDGESFQEAAEREAFEEIGLRVDSLGPLGELKFEMEGTNFDVTFFETEIKGGGHGDIIRNPREHSRLDWVKLGELKDLEWVGENRKFAEWLVEFNKLREPISGDTY